MFKAIWGQAHTNNSFVNPKIKDNTVRLSVTSRFDGDSIKIKFYNKYDKKPFTVVEGVVEIDGMVHELCFSNQKSLSLSLGESRFSDVIKADIKVGSKITVSYYLKGKVTSGNSLIEDCKISKEKGNHVHEISFVKCEKNRSDIKNGLELAIPAIEEISVNCSEENRVIACFGDSITQKCQWTLPLQKMFDQDHKQVAVINKGINGNMLLKDPIMFFFNMFGKSGVSRFDNDILDLSGVTDLIIALGTNDIAMNRKPLLSTEVYFSALDALIEKAEKQKIKVYVATIAPRGDDKAFTPAMKEIRLKINEEIRNRYDYIEYAQGMGLENDLNTLDETKALEDKLHPNEKGGKAIAEIIYQKLGR